MKYSEKIISGAPSPGRRNPRRNGKLFSFGRRFVPILFLVGTASALLAACSPVSSDGTIPRNSVHVPRTDRFLTIKREMTFEYWEKPVEKRTVRMPEGEYIFEGEDDIFLYFRSPEPLEYRVHHKEGYAEGFFQPGGIALACKKQWDKVEFPVCSYTDGETARQKRLTCPLVKSSDKESAFMTELRGQDWDSDFDEE